MKYRKTSAGFSAFELIIVVLVIAIVATAGYWVYNQNKATAPLAGTSNKASSQPSKTATATDVSSVPQINSSGDLTKAEQILDQNDPSSANNSDSSQLNSQLSAF